MQQRINYAVTSILFGVFFYSSSVAAQSVKFSNGFPVTKKSEIFSMDELKTGMTGVGYTVFQGDKAEEQGEAEERSACSSCYGHIVLLQYKSGEEN